MFAFLFLGFCLGIALTTVAGWMYYDKYIEPFIDYSNMPTHDAEPEKLYLFEDPNFRS